MSFLDFLTKNLTKPGVTDNGQTTYYDNPALAAIGLAKASAENAQPIGTNVDASIGDSETPGNFQVTEQTPNNPEPTMATPSFLRASHDPLGLPMANSPALTKKGALMSVLINGLEGGARAAGTKTFGQGFQTAEEAPIQMAGAKLGLEREGLQNRVLSQTLPFLGLKTSAEIQKVLSEVNKNQAEAGKAGAEAGRVPSQQALDEANALKAQFHDVDGVTYRIGKDQSGQPTMTPIDANAGIPASAEIAGVLNVAPGSNVPISRALKAADLLTKGITNYTTGEGVFEHNRITGTKTRLGSAPAITSVKIQQGALANTPNIPEGATGETALVNVDPTLADTVRFYGDGRGDLGTFMGRMNPSSRTNFIALLKAYNPAYKQYDFNVAKGTETKAAESEVPSKIGDQKVAFNTMIDHAELLKKAATALQNRDMKAFNSLKNDLKSAFGSSDLTDFNAIANAYNHEVTTVISKGHITDSEVKTGGATMPSNANLETINKVLDSYKALAKSKMKNLNKQKQDAIDQSQHAKPAAQAAPANPHADIGFVPISQ